MSDQTTNLPVLTKFEQDLAMEAGRREEQVRILRHRLHFIMAELTGPLTNKSKVAAAIFTIRNMLEQSKDWVK